MVRGGIFGTANPAAGALLRNLDSFTLYIAHAKERYEMEVEKREEAERLRRIEEAARQHVSQQLRLAEGRILELEREVARLSAGESNAVQGNLPYCDTTNGWEGNFDAYRYARY